MCWELFCVGKSVKMVICLCGVVRGVFLCSEVGILLSCVFQGVVC